MQRISALNEYSQNEWVFAWIMYVFVCEWVCVCCQLNAFNLWTPRLSAGN